MLRFDTVKAIQASATLLKTSPSHRMTRLRLLKLLYIADRESLAETGQPITGDHGFALKHGPVLSRIYDLIKGRDVGSPNWDRFFSAPDKWNVELAADPGLGQLSRYEIEKLQEVASRFEDQNDWEVAEATHSFPEWQKNQPEGNTARKIPLDDLLEAVGLLPRKQELLSEAAAMAAFDDLLASARR